MKKQQLIFTVLIIMGLSFLIWILFSGPPTPPTPPQGEDPKPLSLDSINIFIENSASIFGYTTTNSEYINVVNDLAQFGNIVSQTEAKFNYRLISGDNQGLTEYELSNDPNVLSSTLSPSGLKRPTSGNSDINGMFNLVLQSVGENSISILISDGIYDIGVESNPLAALETQGIGTRTTFINNLKEKNTETLVIKLSSDFEGEYYPGAKKGVESIKHKRPYYVWIFGDEQLVDTYFSDEKIQGLKGYQNHTAFKKLGETKVDYRNFSFGNSNVKVASRDPISYEVVRAGESVVFSIATNLDLIRLEETYLNDPSNYRISLGYNLDTCIRMNQYSDPAGKVAKDLKNFTFTPSHLIFVSSEKSTLGPVEISLIPKLPNWIEESTMESDAPLNGDGDKTFGLSTLMNGINEAYLEVSNAKEIFKLTINIKD
ncbi:hypothetical protein [Algoriphagus persicinus]|uniref:hypothetical protein n=1 Tax=Algoriphagus persicinus TaxID=3108754 RepID=UPI002B389800|nr:hypothetical protein [Algoriphagus sp. E1-3-M2]MEB2787322.1 hypothetical protein [Algoriphagus sp. E1-3-M2]